MSQERFAMVGSQADTETALLDTRPGVRLLGRALASQWPNQIKLWVEAEHARGTDVNDLLRALFALQIQIAAGTAGSLFREPAYETLLINYRTMLDAEFIKVAQLAGSMAAKARHK